MKHDPSKSPRKKPNDVGSTKARVRFAKIEYLYEDENFVAIQKPARITSISERWDPHAPTVIDELWKIWKKDNPEVDRPHVIHRLDKDTSGLMLFAKHRDAQIHLRMQFQERSIHKEYVALVLGKAPSAGEIEIQVQESPKKAGVMEVVKKGKLSYTRYEVMDYYRGYSWVRLFPKTGRKHQIRISLSHIGHPCAVDHTYGGRKALYASEWIRNYKLGKGQQESPIIDRVTLHADKLSLQLPKLSAAGDTQEAAGQKPAFSALNSNENQTLELHAPLPKDLRVLLKQLTKHAKLPS